METIISARNLFSLRTLHTGLVSPQHGDYNARLPAEMAKPIRQQMGR